MEFTSFYQKGWIFSLCLSLCLSPACQGWTRWLLWHWQAGSGHGWRLECSGWSGTLRFCLKRSLMWWPESTCSSPPSKAPKAQNCYNQHTPQTPTTVHGYGWKCKENQPQLIPSGCAPPETPPRGCTWAALGLCITHTQSAQQLWAAASPHGTAAQRAQ